MSALHHMASPSVLWREKPGQHQWLVLHSIPLHPSALCCEKPTKGRLKWKQNTRCPACVWTCLGQESVCFLLWFWFSGLFRLVLSRRQKFNWLCLVLRRNQELEFGKSLRQEPMKRFTSRLRFVLVKVVCNRNEEGNCEKLSAAGQMLSHWAQT